MTQRVAQSNDLIERTNIREHDLHGHQHPTESERAEWARQRESRQREAYANRPFQGYGITKYILPTLLFLGLLIGIAAASGIRI